MNIFTKWRFGFAIAFALYVGFLAGGIVGAAGMLPWMIGLMLLAVLAILVVVLWFKALADWQQVDEEPARCECGELLEGQYNNGEEHDECAICREGRLTDEAYEQVKEA